jgi:tRNA pseudouridine55 synthase
VEVDMPVRRSIVHALDLVSRDDTSVTLDLHVSSGTYVRSIAQALGGHCTALRRTAVGPFTIDEAQPPERFELLPEDEVLERL